MATETEPSPVIADAVDYFVRVVVPRSKGDAVSHEEYVGVGYLLGDGKRGLVLNGRLEHTRHQVDSWYRWRRYLIKYGTEMFSTTGLTMSIEDFIAWVDALEHGERSHHFAHQMVEAPGRVGDHLDWMDHQGYSLSQGWSSYPPRLPSAGEA